MKKADLVGLWHALTDPPPRENHEHYRHELKYRISDAEKAALTVRMAPLLRLDAHAKNGG